jgi:hypothetical protein
MLRMCAELFYLVEFHLELVLSQTPDHRLHDVSHLHSLYVAEVRWWELALLYEDDLVSVA